MTGVRPVDAKNLSTQETEQNTRLVRAITSFFGIWSRFVADHAVVLIIVCNVITLIGTFKVATTPNENDITGYTPYGARARDEFDVMTDFFSRNGNGVAEFLLVLPKQGENVLEPEILKEILRVEKILTTQFTMENSSGANETYREFCNSFCQINDPFVQFAKTFIASQKMQASGQKKLDRVQLDYPISTLFSRKMNIQSNFFGVELHEDEANTTRRISNMKSSKLVALQLRAERKAGWTTNQVKQFETQVTEYFKNNFTSSKVRVLTLSTTFVESEVVRAGMSLLPFLVVGFVIMAIVSTITTMLSALYMQQVSIHKFSLAICACICPFMACGTALGAMFFCGFRFGSILCVTPFLVLAIGVDDAYLMIHAWQRVTAKRRHFPVPGDSPASRLAEVLADTGPAILISALTNILADTAGTFTSSPEVSLLAYGNMACIAVDFVYQITFYAAIMTLAGHFEMKSEKERDQTSPAKAEEPQGKSFNVVVKRTFEEFLNGYISFVTNTVFGTLVVLAWAAFLATSIYGITIMEVNLSPKKLFKADSALQEMDDLRVQYVIPHYSLATVFISKPGNLSDEKRVALLDNMVSEMESLSGSWGAPSTNYFLRDFKDFDDSMKEFEGKTESTGAVSMDNMPAFLQWPEYSFWKGFVRYHETGGKIILDKFFITFAFHGEQLRVWLARGEMLKSWRNVIDKYRTEFNASAYSDDGIYLDLIDNMPTDSWQSAAATLACMALICFVFMFDLFTVFVATGIIASIMTGILGMLSLTGTDLDPIVMSALIISIGFSVDIPAHVAYHYHSAGRDLAPSGRLHQTLSSVGFPAIQASISTSLCVLSLKLTDVYMSNVFVKTMIICMGLCVVHALLLLPCLVSLCHTLFLKLGRSRSS
ncbi:unnamed protein product [Caenorhabditis auriculariae]|uniref:SSD domain-containing protein n=1 Tax=Caenorhabditis auriculariae TaxID=2777116 RepID=A0A8S1GLY2_9PELO|nr:unnamed protein product [Caenorhabditis auriculariae]